MSKILPYAIFLVSLVILTQQNASNAFPQLPSDTCLHCHGNLSPNTSPKSNQQPPLLAKHFSMNWLMHEFRADENPPFSENHIALRTTHGQTYYDWDEKKMIEIYFGRCINIFPSGNNFSCKFISLRHRTYLIKYPLENLSLPKSCCRWSNEPFWAPRPDVLRNMKFHKQSQKDYQKVNWWIYEIPLPGPFGYGTLDETSVPVAFFFPVINAWAQQNFSDYSTNKPSPKVFELPDICKRPELKICN